MTRETRVQFYERRLAENKDNWTPSYYRAALAAARAAEKAR